MSVFGDYSDAALQAAIEEYATSPGYLRAARVLLTVPAEVRRDIETEGTIRSNVVGGTWASGIEWAAQDFLGNREYTNYTRANSKMLRQEKLSGRGTRMITSDGRVRPSRIPLPATS